MLFAFFSRCCVSPSLTLSVVEREESLIVRADAGGRLEEVDQGLTLSREAVHNVLGVIRNRRLEEEGQVGEDGSESFAVDVDSAEELAEDEHVDHDGHGQQRVLTDVVRGDGVHSVHENLGGVLVEGSLGVTHEGHILNDDLVVDVVLSLGVEDGVALDRVVEDTALGDLLGLEALVLGEVLPVVVSKMVVRDNAGKSQAGADQEITHDSLVASLARLEIAASDQSALLSGVFHHSGVESVLGRPVEVEDALLNGSDAVEDGGG